MLGGKRGVFFDAGFTLVEPVLPVGEAYFRSARALGVELPEDSFRARLAQAWREVHRAYRSAHPDLESSDDLEREAWRRFTLHVAEPFEELRKMHARWLALLFEHFDGPAAWRPIDGARELLGALRQRGLAVGVVSNWHSVLHEILEGHGLAREVDFILTSAEAGRKKPHPGIFAKALERVGLSPSEVVHIGDSWDDDVLGARGAGLSAIHFCRAADAPPADPLVPRIARLSDLAPDPIEGFPK